MKEVLKLALEALENALNKPMWDRPKMTKTITAIKEALAQPEKGLFIDLIAQHEGLAEELAQPPKRPWVGLTDEFCITNMFDMGHYSLQIVFKSRKNADEFKAALKEKNT